MPPAVQQVLNLASRRGTRLDKRLLERPSSTPRLWLRFAFRYAVCVLGLLVVATTNLGHWLQITFLLLLAWLAANGSLSALRRAQAYREGWLEGRHTLLHQIPELLAGDVPLSRWHRQQLAREMEALGMDPSEIFCHLDDIEDVDAR